MPKHYIHKKTGALYQYLGCCVNKTTGPDDGAMMVRYGDLSIPPNEFVRDFKEFDDKFRQATPEEVLARKAEPEGERAEE